MPDAVTHDRFNEAVLAHLAVAMEAQDALSAAVNLAGPYQADIAAATLTFGETTLRVVLLGTVSKQGGTWRWSWANQGFPPDSPAIAPVHRIAELAQAWGLWELGQAEFWLHGIVDTGLGPGASIAVLACPLVGAVGFFQADYGAGLAYFGIVDQQVPRPHPTIDALPGVILRADDRFPGMGRRQLLTYASVHDLRITGSDRSLIVHLGPDAALQVDFDANDRPIRFGSIPRPA